MRVIVCVLVTGAASMVSAGQFPPGYVDPRSFYDQVQRMKLDVGTIAPVHGKPVAWSEFARLMR